MNLLRSESLAQFLAGAVMLGFLVVAMLFLRFWKQTRDRFFLIFSIAFCMLAIDRLVLQWINPLSDIQPYGYLIRLAAYGCILWAIIDKNRQAK